MNRKINLVFPAAGQGTRFGGVEYKPFLKVGDITFIEEAFNSFTPYKHLIENVILICTEEQDRKFSVEKRIKETIDHPRVIVIKIPEATPGPYQTVRAAIAMSPELKDSKAVSIICDCDHTLNVSALFDAIEKDAPFDVLIPGWNILPEEQKNWSKVVSAGDTVVDVVEKDIIDTKKFKIKGIIGCIGFKNIHSVFTSPTHVYISDATKELFRAGKKIVVVDVPDAGFFGDPAMLENYVNQRRKRSTIFCDIDGVLIKHKPHSDFSDDNVVLPGVEKLRAWKRAKHRIVLTTARNERYRDELIPYLHKHDIPFDDIVMGLPAGQRFLINDRKPSKHFTRQAIGVELTRDEGLSSIDLDGHIATNDIKLLSPFKGNSFARTYLIEVGNSKFVRKHILKSPKNVVHVQKLKRQYHDLNRFNFMLPGLAPQTLSDTENDYEYFFDMEYLDGYKELSDFSGPTQEKVLEMLLPKFNEYVYSFRKPTTDTSWMTNFLKKKIYPKFQSYEEDEVMKHLIRSDEVVINSKKYLGLAKILETLDLAKYNPRFISPAHGDFTFDNVLYNESNNDARVIDMDASDYFDAPELDLGKLFQSCVANYNKWRHMEKPVTSLDVANIQCISDFFDVVPTKVNNTLVRLWSKILDAPEDEVLGRGIFYMSTYFIRFVPFRQQISREHGIFALILSIVWLNKLKTNL